MSLENKLHDLDHLSYQDLNVLKIHSEGGCQTATSILKGWMQSRPFEDATYGGVEGEKVLGHYNSTPCLETSTLVSWKDGAWYTEDGRTTATLTHFSELETEFFEDVTHFEMINVETQVTGFGFKKLVSKLTSKMGTVAFSKS